MSVKMGESRESLENPIINALSKVVWNWLLLFIEKYLKTCHCPKPSLSACMYTLDDSQSGEWWCVCVYGRL